GRDPASVSASTWANWPGQPGGEADEPGRPDAPGAAGGLRGRAGPGASFWPGEPGPDERAAPWAPPRSALSRLALSRLARPELVLPGPVLPGPVSRRGNAPAGPGAATSASYGGAESGMRYRRIASGSGNGRGPEGERGRAGGCGHPASAVPVPPGSPAAGPPGADGSPRGRSGGKAGMAPPGRVSDLAGRPAPVRAPGRGRLP